MDREWEILLAHRDRYPRMTLQDWGKLLYQREFGPGHLLRDPERAKEYLRREWETQERTDQVFSEDIGGGLVRVHLAGLTERGMEALWQAFYATAQVPRGSREAFAQALTVLPRLAGAGEIPFSVEDVNAYLDAYAQAGYPMVSHSEIYRTLYHPAYRVVERDIWREMEETYGPL